MTGCWRTAILVALIGLCSVANALPERREALTIGVLPYLVPTHMATTYGAAIADLSKHIRREIRLLTSPDFAQFHDNLRQQQYDFAIVNPFDVNAAVEQYNYVPIARVGIPLVTVFVTAANSSVMDINALKGRVVAMPSAEAATSRIAVEWLRERGLNDTNIRIRFFNSHDACIQEAFSGRAAVCATAKPPMLAFEKRIGTALRMIAETPPIPHIALLGHRRVSEEIRHQVQDRVTHWQNDRGGQEILAVLHFPSLVNAGIDDYMPLRNFRYSPPKPTTNIAQRDYYVLGAFPYVPPKALAELFASLQLRIRMRLPRDLQFRTAFGFMQYRANLLRGDYDIALIQPYDYRDAVNSGYIPVAQMKGSLTAQFYVREGDARIGSIADLRGKIIAMPPTNSALARLGLEHLSQHGLEPNRDLHIDFRRSHDSCIEQLLKQRADVCVTTHIALERIARVEPNQRLRSISSSPPIPSVFFAVHQRMGPELLEVIKDQILTLGKNDNGREVLEKLRLDEFVPFQANEYQQLKR